MSKNKDILLNELTKTLKMKEYIENTIDINFPQIIYPDPNAELGLSDREKECRKTLIDTKTFLTNLELALINVIGKMR